MPFTTITRRRSAPIISRTCCTERRSSSFEGRDFLAIGGTTDEVEAGGGITIGSDGSNFVNFSTTSDPAGVSATLAFLQAAFPNAQITIVPNGNTATGEDWVVSGDTTVDWTAATSYPGASVTGSPTGPVAYGETGAGDALTVTFTAAAADTATFTATPGEKIVSIEVTRADGNYPAEGEALQTFATYTDENGQEFPLYNDERIHTENFADGIADGQITLTTEPGFAGTVEVEYRVCRNDDGMIDQTEINSTVDGLVDFSGMD